ncbi:MAG: DNA-3-methyladenine glycosylase [Candidatus Krumholzibacteriota bacterium]|nr:DNA-3-methyladenine glycosylase [Candidatus Krumholzibacteriota bacterium]
MLGPEFFDRPVLAVARDLLGRVLVRRWRGRRLAGRIVETEAYAGDGDAASHAARGPTPRNAVMFGPPGRAYVYQVYGMHHCLNLVCGPLGRAQAVLVRAVEPLEGDALMASLRPGVARRDWARGPGRLCRAFAIDRGLDGAALPGPGLWLEAGRRLPARRRAAGPRVGVAYAGEAAGWPWRFWERDSPWVSGPRREAPGGIRGRRGSR